MRDLIWRKHGVGYRLWYGKRRMGEIVPDTKYPGMWRSLMSGGHLSDMANITWAREAVRRAAEREIDFEGRDDSSPDTLVSVGKQSTFSGEKPAGATKPEGRYPPTGADAVTHAAEEAMP
jgi:hypothetical protein